MKRFDVGILLISFSLRIFAATPDYAATIANLIEPAKLSTLRERGANPRVQKAVYWLHSAKKQGENPALILDLAVSKAGYTNKIAAELTKEALLRNVKIAEALGCFDAEGLEEMRRGKSPTVKKGPYVGDQLSVDHIIPRAVVPELDNVIANLELMPLKLNMKKNASLGDRQRDTARKLAQAGLLGSQGLSRVLALTKEPLKELSLTR